MGSFVLSTCRVGRATRSPRAGGMAWPPETISIPEPFKASTSLSLYPTETTVRGQARLLDS